MEKAEVLKASIALKQTANSYGVIVALVGVWGFLFLCY